MKKDDRSAARSHDGTFHGRLCIQPETAAPADTAAEPAAAETAAAADSDLAYIQDKGTLVIGIHRL